MNNIKSFNNIIIVFSSLAASLFLLSCDGNRIAAGGEEGVVTTQGYTDVALENAKFTSQPTPKEVFAAFSEMAEEVRTMSREQVEALSDEEILELGAPIRLATDGTILLSEKTLQQLREPLGELTDRLPAMTREEHRALSSEIDRIISSDGRQNRRNLSARQIRDLLLELNSETMSFSLTCEQMFTVQGQNVILMVGDNFNLANHYCPAGYQFTITSGTHTGQYVAQSNTGNTWVGAGTSPVMDGQNNVAAAFSAGGLIDNSISGFEIRNYKDYGIISASSSTKNVNIYNMTFKNIGANRDGQTYGAIRFDNTENVWVQNSYFENVTSAIRFRFSDGPLRVLNNEALNTGRNFFQCDKCNGGGIKINGNSMDRTSDYGTAELEDWISIFNSHGTQNNWIEVNNNRARGHSNSDSGSFIILADSTGTYQMAAGNIGVTPGQVGIGVASGEHMLVKNNKMYSEQWTYSNVAFYSIRFHTPCNNHEFPASPDPNLANWICGWSGKCPVGQPWRAWASQAPNPNCGIDFDQIRANVQDDLNMDENIWNDW